MLKLSVKMLPYGKRCDRAVDQFEHHPFNVMVLSLKWLQLICLMVLENKTGKIGFIAY
jgi:hypothetical protein